MSVNKLNSILQKAGEIWKNTDKSKKQIAVSVAIVALVVLISVSFFVSKVNYSVLYTNLDPKEAGEIMAKLNEMKVDAKPSGTDTILVPKEDVDRLRMQLAAEGYPKGSLSLDILQNASGFGVTQQDKQIYRQYQLQEHLQNAIKTLNGVKDARVYLTMPEESNFVISDNKKSASAAVLLTLQPGTVLSQNNITAIAQFVQKSVPGLNKEDITIIDSMMNVLSFDNGDENIKVNDKIQLEKTVSQKLKQQIMSLLQPVFGMDKVMAEVNVVLDFDETVTESIRFEPITEDNKGVIISIDSIREQIISKENLEGVPGVDENIGDSSPVLNADNSIYLKNAEKINYEVNTIKEKIISEKGKIKDLSVSVIIDGNEYTADYSEHISNLVSNAVGVEPQYITVASLPFNGNKAMKEQFEELNKINEKLNQMKQLRFYITVAAIVFMGLVTILMLYKLLTRKKKVTADDGYDKFLAELSANITKTAAGINAAETEETAEKPKPKYDVEQIEKHIDQDPELVASIIKNWISNG